MPRPPIAMDSLRTRILRFSGDGTILYTQGYDFTHGYDKPPQIRLRSWDAMSGKNGPLI